MKNQILTLSFVFGIFFHLSAQIWQQQDAQFPSPTIVWDIIVPNENTAWTYGFEFDGTGNITEENYTISKTINGGQTWENLNFPHTEPGFISNVAAINENVAWISYVDYTNGQKILKTTDGGQTWKEQANGFTVWINFVHFFNGTSGVAMGDPNEGSFEIFTTGNGGASWEEVNAANIPPILPGEFGFASFYEVSGNKIWFETSEGRVYFSLNKGFTWDVFSGPQPELYSMFAADDAGMCYIAYFDPSLFPPILALYRTPDNGLTWEDITPADKEWGINDIEPIPGTNTIISQWNRNVDSRIFETRLSYDQGTSWITIDSGALVRTFDFFNDEVGFASGWQFLNDPSTKGVYKYIGSPLTGLFKHEPLDVSLSVAPNPTVDFVRVALESPTAQEFLLLVNDVNGRLIYKQVFEKTSRLESSFDFSQLAAGVYTVTVSSKEGMAKQNVLKQ